MGVVDHNNIAEILYNVFIARGIFGRNDMPEDVIPNGVMKGSLEHLLFITLTVSIDYQRDVNEVWRSSRETFNQVFIKVQLSLSTAPENLPDS